MPHVVYPLRCLALDVCKELGEARCKLRSCESPGRSSAPLGKTGCLSCSLRTVRLLLLQLDRLQGFRLVRLLGSNLNP